MPRCPSTRWSARSQTSPQRHSASARSPSTIRQRTPARATATTSWSRARQADSRRRRRRSRRTASNRFRRRCSPLRSRGELEGYITRFVSSSDFDVNGVRAAVNSQTTYQGGSAASLALNVKVELRGVVNASAVLVASSVEFESTGSIRIEGSVEQIDTTASRVTVLQVPVTIGAGTHLEDQSSANVNPLTLADLAVADRVEIRAYLDGSTVVASELEREVAKPGASLRGRVTSINATTFQLAILGVNIIVDGSTQYEGAANRDAFFAAVRVGDFVEAEWDNFAAAAPQARSRSRTTSQTTRLRRCCALALASCSVFRCEPFDHSASSQLSGHVAPYIGAHVENAACGVFPCGLNVVTNLSTTMRNDHPPRNHRVIPRLSTGIVRLFHFPST